MMPQLLSSGPLNWNSATTAISGKATPEQIKSTAAEFESLLIGQIMKSMRESSGGWLGCDSDQTGASMSEFAEQQMAQLLSTNGGFGLAGLIEQGLARGAQPEMLSEEAAPKPEASKA